MINIYSDDHQTALKYLKDTKANIYNVLVMVVDFEHQELWLGLFLPFSFGLEWFSPGYSWFVQS